jgi:hypothetical protein
MTLVMGDDPPSENTARAMDVPATTWWLVTIRFGPMINPEPCDQPEFLYHGE